MRVFALLLPVLLLLTACSARPVDHEQVSPADRLVLRFSHVTAENSPKHLGALQFARGVWTASGGHVEVQVFPNSQLYKDGEEFGALQDGSVHLIAPAMSKLAQIDPAWQVYDLPYLFRSFDDVQRLFDSPLGLEMRQRLEPKGYVALAVWPNGLKQFTNLRRPLVGPADFQGLTLRVQAPLVLQEMYGAVGATIVVRGFDSVYAAVEQRQIDGQENTLSNIYTRNLQEVQPFLTLSDHGYLGYVVLAQAAWWKGLPPQLRASLQTALADATKWTRDNAPAMNKEALTKLTASGRVQIRTLSLDERAALRTAFDPAYQAVADRLGKPFLDRVIATVRAEPPE